MRSHFIPWLFVAGMALVVTVNGVLVYFALGTWSGLVVERPYERGVQYNRLLDAAARQEALGWQFEVALQNAGETTLVSVRASDASGRPLSGLNLRAGVERPVEKETLGEVRLVESGTGHYTASLERLRPGQWQTRVLAERGTDRAAATQRQFIR